VSFDIGKADFSVICFQEWKKIRFQACSADTETDGRNTTCLIHGYAFLLSHRTRGQAIAISLI
jgi:hypothetical protein